MPRSRALAFVIKEFKELLPPTLFFVVGFNLIELTTQLFLDDYLERFANYAVATVAALVVGKAVLVANVLPFIRRYDTDPLIRPILFKTVVYTIVVLLVRFLEKLVEYLVGGGTIGGLPDYVAHHFTWHRFAAIQIWTFVLFLIYTSVTELNALFGEGELVKSLFTRRSSELKLTRRQRVRALVKLSRLTAAHTPDELGDRNNAAHGELIDLIRGLAMRETSSVHQASHR
jgi:hypothetical protein